MSVVDDFGGVGGDGTSSCWARDSTRGGQIVHMPTCNAMVEAVVCEMPAATCFSESDRGVGITQT